MPKEQSSEELSSLAARVLKMEPMHVPNPEYVEHANAKEYNNILEIAKRLAGSVLTQDETPECED